VAVMEHLRRYLPAGFAAVLVSGLALGVGGCGVKSTPQHPEGAVYPRAYPEALPPPPVVYKSDKRRVPSTGPAAGTSAPASGIYQYPNSPSYQPPKQ